MLTLRFGQAAEGEDLQWQSFRLGDSGPGSWDVTTATATWAGLGFAPNAHMFGPGLKPVNGQIQRNGFAAVPVPGKVFQKRDLD